MGIQLRGVAVLSLSLLLPAGAAFASSPDAWKEFIDDVQEKCLLATLPHAQASEPVGVLVDPYGSDSYGFAIIQMKNKEDQKLSLFACAYDKQTMKAEISTAFTDGE